MDEITKQRLKNIKRSECGVCGHKSTYTSPLAKCHECKKKFCYDHIYANQVKQGMKPNDPLRDVCDECKDSKGYRIC